MKLLRGIQHIIELHCSDVLAELNVDWHRLECLHLCRALRGYLRCIPSVETYVMIVPESLQLIEELVYAGQRPTMYRKKVSSRMTAAVDGTMLMILSEE